MPLDILNQQLKIMLNSKYIIAIKTNFNHNFQLSILDSLLIKVMKGNLFISITYLFFIIID